jgi:YHS domain-containing protein
MNRDGKLLDPICDMVVDVAQQRAKGLTTVWESNEYAFCGPGCKRRFDADPAAYTKKVDDWLRS